ncbi:hypothetical protein QEN58_03175 [Halomonas alkaliantarctica]|uniref:EamA-like transporter family protein n=1 Tax=Halomonas alkaliantarctica TaxID=232346 RepID=A0ABY8LR53_9GAMM|nr:hypothetical protein [Halomonas alkaliantarctica]WGI26074.1 hypothetical protein QEN58_03175 [Halomonas alkaliantarctica]
MSLEITMIVLLAAIFNASWNAIVKVSGDRIAVMAVITLLGSLVSVFALPFVALPDSASWPLLGLAILIHTAYHFCLPMAYHYGDFGQVYPIARGSAPLLVTLGAAAFAGEMLGMLPLFGVLFLGVGVMSLSFDTHAGITRNPRAILLALGTGALIASYTLVGGLGARLCGFIDPRQRLADVCDCSDMESQGDKKSYIQQFGTRRCWRWNAGRCVLDRYLGHGLRSSRHGIGSTRNQRTFRGADFHSHSERGLRRMAVCFFRPDRLRHCFVTLQALIKPSREPACYWL